MNHPAIEAKCTPEEVETFNKIAVGVGSHKWTMDPDGKVTAREPLPKSTPISGADFSNLKTKGLIDYLVEHGGQSKVGVSIGDDGEEIPLYEKYLIITPHMTMDADFAYRRWKMQNNQSTNKTKAKEKG